MTGIVELHKSVQRKNFHPSKICRFINQFAAMQIYKQTILPILDYCGFVTMSGIRESFDDMQVLQNDAIKICTDYPHGYTLSRIDLHNEI